MMHYEVEREQWPYKGTDATLLGNGFNCFFYYYPKKVTKALWKYDIWDNLWNEKAQIAYVQTWAKSINDMHSYPFTSLDELVHYLIKKEGYSYRNLFMLGYDSVNELNPDDDILVLEYGCFVRSYSKWMDFMQDFDAYGNWDAFIAWATNPYGDNSVAALKKALKAKETGVHFDYIEMLGDHFGPDLEKLTGDKREWFIRRIKDMYKVGEDEAERILLGKE